MEHYIIVKFIDSINIYELEKPIKDLFSETLHISGVKGVEIKISNTSLSNRHHLMIKMILTPEALIEFDNSEIHAKWKAQYGDLIISKTIFDCD